jgi:hypothetical protein
MQATLHERKLPLYATRMKKSKGIEGDDCLNFKIESREEEEDAKRKGK